MRHERLLVALAVVTGMVDAVSYLGLGQVFVANMTGNVVFIGFAVAGDSHLSAWASLLAIAAFAAGAWSTGWLVRHSPESGKDRVFSKVTAVHLGLLAVALVVTLTLDHRDTWVRAVLIVVLACGMGLQNSVVRALAIPDLATNVLTTTLTGLAADSPGPASKRRLASIVAMLLGALLGAALHLHVGSAAAVLAATLVLGAVVVTTAIGPGPAAPAR